MAEIRLSLKDVKNPSDLSLDKHILFKRDSDGFASRDLIAGLQSHGVLMELQVALQNSKSTPKTDAVSKKN